MKKFLSAAFALLLLAACQKNDNSFVGNDYRLQNAPDGAEITLGFDGAESRFFGKAAINRYFGTYAADGNNLTFNAAGSTMMAGPENLMKAEQDYLRFLPEVKTFSFQGTDLILKSADGKELVFKKIGKIKNND